MRSVWDTWHLAPLAYSIWGQGGHDGHGMRGSDASYEAMVATIDEWQALAHARL